MTKKINPIRETDAEAQDLARSLLKAANFAALSFRLPENDWPMVTRIAFALDQNGSPISLMSDLSEHTKALRADPKCAILVGEPGNKGDPLTHPRLSMQCTAQLLTRDDPSYTALRSVYLEQQPKAKLYIDFGDFHLVRLNVDRAFLNGGFGKAYRLTAADLAEG